MVLLWLTLSLSLFVSLYLSLSFAVTCISGQDIGQRIGRCGSTVSLRLSLSLYLFVSLYLLVSLYLSLSLLCYGYLHIRPRHRAETW